MQRKLLARLPAFHRNALQFEEMKKTSNAQLQKNENFDVRCWMFRVGSFWQTMDFSRTSIA